MRLDMESLNPLRRATSMLLAGLFLLMAAPARADMTPTPPPGEAYVKMGRLDDGRRVLDRLEPLDAGRAAELGDALRGAATGEPTDHKK